jgi:hypothetical protein
VLHPSLCCSFSLCTDFFLQSGLFSPKLILIRSLHGCWPMFAVLSVRFLTLRHWSVFHRYLCLLPCLPSVPWKRPAQSRSCGPSGCFVRDSSGTTDFSSTEFSFGGRSVRLFSVCACSRVVFSTVGLFGFWLLASPEWCSPFSVHSVS